MGLLPLRFEVVEDDLVEGRFLLRPGPALTVGHRGIVVCRKLLDLSGQSSEAAGLDGIDNRTMLALHEGCDRFPVDILLDKVVVGGPPRVEDLTAGVDERFDERICPPFVLGLHVIGGARVLDIGVETGQDHSGHSPPFKRLARRPSVVNRTRSVPRGGWRKSPPTRDLRRRFNSRFTIGAWHGSESCSSASATVVDHRWRRPSREP